MRECKISVPGVCICFFMLALVSCQSVVPVQRGTLPEPPVKSTGKIYVGDLTENVRKSPPNKIGNHTVTFFAFPTIPIQPSVPPGMQEAMREHIIAALEKAGYAVVPVTAGEESLNPVLRGEIRKFWFASYWWFYPIALVGGKINLQLILEDPGGSILWEKKCGGSAFMILPFYAKVDFLVKGAVTNVCKDIIEAVGSDEFKTALTRSTVLLQK